jgi:hypothetical protein
MVIEFVDSRKPGLYIVQCTEKQRRLQCRSSQKLLLSHMRLNAAKAAAVTAQVTQMAVQQLYSA